MIHGNGGGKTRFRPFLSHLRRHEISLSVHIPDLPGFEERPFPKVEDPWQPFIQAVGDCIDLTQDWILYGHGIGGSLLLEWATRNYKLPDGREFTPQKVILQSIIGASLHKRFFPKLMKPMWIRRSMQSLIANPALRPVWKRRLFRQPENIPPRILHRFFDDYAHCEAFPVFFDLITPDWYRDVQGKLKNEEFLFVWGDRERVVKSKYLGLWKEDFPQSEFVVIPSWDHFPMLDDVEDFTEKLLNLLGYE